MSAMEREARSVIAEWRSSPPSIMIIGDGPGASALAAIFESVTLPWGFLQGDVPADAEGKYSQVLSDLKSVLMVVPAQMTAANALQIHDAVWRWVEKLAPNADQHDLRFVFVFPTQVAETFERSLAFGLGVSKIGRPCIGHGIWRLGEGLENLVDLLVEMPPSDFQMLLARRRAETKYSVLAKLREVTTQDDVALAREVAVEVLREFAGEEFLLDIFCRDPSHRSGSQLRSWLEKIVAGALPLGDSGDPQLPGRWLK